MLLPKIAVIGAGLSGLVLAQQLKDHATVTVFEKSRGVGGRMATRYADPYQFDHGAQFFTAKTTGLQAFLEPLIQQGIVARWDARFVEFDHDTITHERQWTAKYPHYVAVPKMNELAKRLALDLNVQLHCEVEYLEKTDDGWQLFDTEHNALGSFDWVIATTPAAQAAQLLPECFSHFNTIKQVKILGCYALMLGFTQALPLTWQAALVRNADISWISVNSSKPGRPEGFTLVVHASNAWAEVHMEDAMDAVQTHMLEEVSTVIGYDVRGAQHCAIHRWRYANIRAQKNKEVFLDNANRLAACGDWCIQGRVEAAFSSAVQLADKIKQVM